jgi:hypothetical protein
MRDLKEIEKRYKGSNRIPKRGGNLFKKSYLIILALIVAFLTNPDEQKHKEAVKSKIENIVMPSQSEYNAGNPYIDQLVNTHVGSTSYFFFSTTEVTWDEEKRTIGFGIFGHVFLVSSHFKSQKIHA